MKSINERKGNWYDEHPFRRQSLQTKGTKYDKKNFEIYWLLRSKREV